MSVVILGMEMPSGCADCIFKYVMFRPLVRCDFQARKLLEIDGTGKLPNCPLRPLPDHHGRLIDADVLENEMFELWKKNEISNSDWIGFREILKDQETVLDIEIKDRRVNKP